MCFPFNLIEFSGVRSERLVSNGFRATDREAPFHYAETSKSSCFTVLLVANPCVECGKIALGSGHMD